MAFLSLPTKNQFAFTHTTSPAGDAVVTIGSNLFVKKQGSSTWSHQEISEYFVGHTLKTDEEKHDAVEFPTASFDQHFFTQKGSEAIVSQGLLFYRIYPTDTVWHVTDHPSVELKESASKNDFSHKRLLISPIAHVALEGNAMFIDSGDRGFNFTIVQALNPNRTFRCKACHVSFQTSTHTRATPICNQCACADLAE